MQRKATRIFVIVFFIALLATPVVYKRIVAHRQAAFESQNEAAVLAQYGFRFKESAKQAGIVFTHQAPTLDAKLNHIMEQVASMGAAVSVVDFDRDGWNDIYLTNSSEHGRNVLYRNLHDG